ncbi:MAG: YcxB family protein [Leadbetterella sp.]
MIVKTKKFSLDKNIYIKKAFAKQFKVIQKWLAIPVAIAVLGLALHFTGTYKNWWILITAIVGGGLFVLFWYAQFYAAANMDQNKQMFDKFMYEIDSSKILVKLNDREGGIIKWEEIQSAEKDEIGYTLHRGRGMMLHFPYKVLNSDHDIKLLETILSRKNLL